MSLGWLFWLIILLSLLFGIAGYLFWPTTWAVAIGVVFGIGTALWVGLEKIARILAPESFYEYSYDTDTVTESIDTSRYLDIQCWTSPTDSHWIRLGVTDDEWRTMAVSVHNSQKFSMDTIDRKIYSKVKERFLQIGLIVREGSGYALTRDGCNFFKFLATSPFPYSEEPGIVKILE